MRHELHHGSGVDFDPMGSLSAGAQRDVVLAHAFLDLTNELRPGYAAHFADDVQPRQPAALDQIVAAVWSGCRTRHLADLVLQAAPDPDAVIAKLMKEPEGTGFERRLHRSGRPTETRDPRD